MVLLSAAALKLGMFMTSGACFTKHLKPKSFGNSIQTVVCLAHVSRSSGLAETIYRAQ